jgi:hypothetical protein
MFEDALNSIIEWLSEQLREVRSALGDAMSEQEWVLLSEDFLQYGNDLRLEFSWVVAASYAIVITIGGMLVMSHESLQTRYTIREIAPRLIVGFLLAGFSFWICLQALDVNNTIAESFRAVDYWDEEFKLSTIQGDLRDGPYMKDPTISDLLIDIVYVLITSVCILMLLLMSFMRNVAWFFVVALSPIGLACHGLPATEWGAQLWWRMLGACMASSIGQSILIWIYVSLTENDMPGMIGPVHIESVYLIVVVWMMVQVHKHAFRLARGRSLRMPGSRFLTGAATALAVGAVTGRFRKRRGNRNADQKRPGADAETEESGDEFGWWDKPDGRASSVSDLGPAFGHRPAVTGGGDRAPWYQRSPGTPPESPSRPGEGEFDSMFEPASPLEHSRRLGGFATDAGRRRGIEQRLAGAENDRLRLEQLRQSQVGSKPRPGRRVADVPALSGGDHRPYGSPVVWQDPARVKADVTAGSTPEHDLWNQASDAVGEAEWRGGRPRSEPPIRVDLVPGPTPEQELWEAAARRAAVMEDLRAREAAELRRRSEGNDES